MQPRPTPCGGYQAFSLLVCATIALSLASSIGMARAGSLEAGFQHPPDSARPHTWWHWMNGNVTREGITADLEAMKRVGIGGAQIFNVDCGIPAGPVKFMSPEWRELVKHAAQEAQRLGLELCLPNCAGWSSSGGPWNTPEHAMQDLTTSEQRVTGLSHFSGVLPAPPAKLGFYRDIAVLAFPATGGKKAASGRVVPRAAIVDLSSRLQPDGHIEWDVPAGEWVILRLGYTPNGRKNHPAPAEGTGLECDKFSQEALDAHWAGCVQKVLDDLGPLAGQGKAFNNVLIDSYEVGDQSWTPRARTEFQKRRGYDPLLYLPTIAGWVVENPAVSERFAWDGRRTAADLFAENYYGHFQELCHQHGLMASIEPYTGPFESLQCGQAADIPMGEFWVGSSPDSSVKLASSVGHIYGRQIIGAESFTAAPSAQHGRWLEDAYSLKALGDQVFCLGANRFIFHRYAMQPWTNRWPGMTMGQWGTHFDRTSIWWEQGRAWLQYVARCQYLLQQGRFVADAAYFDGESAPVGLRAGDPPLPAGYDYDGVNAGVLLRATVNNGRLELPSGMSYRVLILPPSERTVTPALLRKLAQLVEQGLTLIGPPPQASPSLENYPQCDAEVKQLAARVWGDCDGRRVTQHPYGRGKAVWNRPLAQVLGELDLKPDFEYPATSGAKLAFIHRRDSEADIYFVSNQRSRYDSSDCTFRVSGKLPELWNPDTGRIEPAPVWREQAGRTVVSLSFDPAGSVFVVFRSQPPGDHLVALERKGPATAEPPAKPRDLRILKAVYGPSENTADVTAMVKSLVAGGDREIWAGNDLADNDPAPGVVKRLRVQFLLNGRQQTTTATEGEALKLPEGAQVLKALYGALPGDAQDENRRDVTAKVKALVADGTLRIRAGNELTGGDPAPNIPKQLRIEYRLNGRKQSAEAGEGQNLDLPNGAEVTKALYGDLRPGAAPRSRTVELTRKLAGLIKHGELSVPINNELAGGDPASMAPKELRVEYSLDGVRHSTTIQENDTLTLPASAQSIGAPPAFTLASGPDGQARLLAWAPGKFSFQWASGGKTAGECRSVPAPLEIPGPWAVSFPPGWAAPDRVTFDRLESWTDHSDPGVKYFSGTATYEKELDVPPDWLRPNRVVCLDLGVVKNFAEVTLNGKPLGILWKPPFRVDITGAARPGKNTLRVKVTNLWPNRLIGDEQLPPDCEWKGRELKAWPPWLLEGKPSPTGRVTFTTWHHWTKDNSLLPSGLLGPVTLRPAEAVMPGKAVPQGR